MSGSKKETVGRRYVDMWAVAKIHPTNIELLQRLKMADDSQFGNHMDVCGTVSEYQPKTGDWAKTWAVGIRSDIWKPDKQEIEKSLRSLKDKRKTELRKDVRKSGRLSDEQRETLAGLIEKDSVTELTEKDIEQRRLILKLFRTTGKRMSWQGSIEELTTAEVHNSLGSKHSLLSFAAVLDGHQLVTRVEQNHRTFRVPAVFSFSFVDERNDRIWHINILRKWFSMGADFVIEADGRPIGLIDGAMIGLGYNATIGVTDRDLGLNRDFLDLVTLFACSVGYHKAMRKSLKRRLQAVRNGHSGCHVVEHEELNLFRNPRRRAA